MKDIKKDDGHYSVPIPFRDEGKLPSNKPMAEGRLAGLGKKLQKNLQLQMAYTESINTLIHKGYAEPVEEDAPAKDGREWYIPHHPVINPNKPKIRVVFDCAAKYQGVALNDKVLQGPDLINSLLGILLRFRQHPVAVSADIEAMFHQVRVPTEDRDVLRFLWWPEGDSNKEPDVYRMTVHLFGGTWSPSVCSYALQQTARYHADEFSSDVTNTVLNDFYVDDLLKSFQSEDTAVKMISDLPALLARGGFRLCKWTSNSQKVMKAVPETERSAGLQSLNFQALPVERTLGVLWDVAADTFIYSGRVLSRPMTRRGLLGTVCSVYDPMGFLTPFTICGKKLVQDLTRSKQGWDDPLEGHHLTRWESWLDELPIASEVKIDRCLLPVECGQVRSTELHHFSDASTAAYGSASYVRFVDPEGQARCRLLFTRSRVAPLRQMTIPRLELAAAALSVQQDGMLRKELSLQCDASYFWTDSAIVLAYIQNERRRFHTYVANRLAVIHDGSTVDQWRHVPSELNPADAITRGMSMQGLLSSPWWFDGPEILKQPTIDHLTEPPPVSLDEDPEVAATTYSTDVKADVLQAFIEWHSTWPKLLRSTAWLLRFKAYLRKQATKPAQLDVDDLKKAEKAIVTCVQRGAYPEELQCLTTAGRIKKSSSLYRLDPKLTPDEVLVCGLRKPEDGSHSTPILPKEHHVVTLLVRHYHERQGHSGREYTVAEIRLHYWIPGVRTIVRRILSQCRRCRRVFSKPGIQRMADLPKERVEVDEPPFTNVGIDCFGPFYTKSGRKQRKRYGCIFTCLTSRAVHLEVLDGLDTSSFINGMQRFLCRRGSPRTICCDNGTNFVGAERELAASISEWNHQMITTFLTTRGTDWKFNPPGASHMGGAWERLIRSVKRVLSALMTQQSITDDALCTLFCLVECIINSRPLTTVSDDPKDLDPITPNHLLLLRPVPLLPPGVFDVKDCYARRRWRQIQYFADVFWRHWLREYLPLIQLRPKWREAKLNLSIGDVVLVVDYNAPRNQWLIGRVCDVFKGSDGLVRSAQIRTPTSTLTRPITKLCFLEGNTHVAKTAPDSASDT